MKKGSTLFLKFVICLIAIGAAIWLIWFPQLEGRAANLDLLSIYKDPLIIYSYIGSIPFFVALYQAFKLLGYIDGNKIFSPSSVNAVKNIKYCAIIFSGFIVLGILYIKLFVINDDPEGGNALGIFAIFILGFFWKKTTSNAALFAIIGGFLFSVLFKFLPGMTDLSFLAQSGFSNGLR